MVRRDDRRERVLQGLKALHARLQAVVASGERAGVGDVGILLQVADRDLPHLRGEVDEIAVVGNPVVIHVPGKARPEGLRVLQRCPVALVLEDRVFRHVFQVQLAGIVALEIAELVLQLEAALLHGDRRDRRVALGRDVPVVRHADFQAARRGVGVVRRENAAAAAVLEREAGERRRDQRVIEEAQARTLRLALLRFVIELDLRPLEPPVLLGGRAGREDRVREAVLVLA